MLTTILSLLKIFFSKYKWKIVMILTYVILIGGLAFTYTKYKKADSLYGDELNNRRQYESLLSNEKSENRQLQLTIVDFVQSNDSIVKELNNTRKQLKIKDSQLDQAMAIKTEIRDTTIVLLPATPVDSLKPCDFTVEIEPNELTYFKVSRKGDSIEHIAKILNQQDLFTYSKKEYRNQGKNFFQRLFTFDWKKDKIERYQIVNSNSLIEITDTRIIKIK